MAIILNNIQLKDAQRQNLNCPQHAHQLQSELQTGLVRPSLGMKTILSKVQLDPRYVATERYNFTITEKEIVFTPVSDSVDIGEIRYSITSGHELAGAAAETVKTANTIWKAHASQHKPASIEAGPEDPLTAQINDVLERGHAALARGEPRSVEERLELLGLIGEIEHLCENDELGWHPDSAFWQLDNLSKQLEDLLPPVDEHPCDGQVQPPLFHSLSFEAEPEATIPEDATLFSAANESPITFDDDVEPQDGDLGMTRAREKREATGLPPDEAIAEPEQIDTETEQPDELSETAEQMHQLQLLVKHEIVALNGLVEAFDATLKTATSGSNAVRLKAQLQHIQDLQASLRNQKRISRDKVKKLRLAKKQFLEAIDKLQGINQTLKNKIARQAKVILFQKTTITKLQKQIRTLDRRLVVAQNHNRQLEATAQLRQKELDAAKTALKDQARYYDERIAEKDKEHELALEGQRVMNADLRSKVANLERVARTPQLLETEDDAFAVNSVQGTVGGISVSNGADDWMW